MKRFYLLLALLAACTAHAQDTLYKIDGTAVPVVIESRAPYVIHFRKAGSPDERVYHISKSKVAVIAYGNRTADTFFRFRGNKIDGRSPLLHLAKDSLYQLGRSDAKLYYKRYSGAMNGTLLATIPGSPLIGAVTATAISLTPPKEQNLGLPNPTLAELPAYYKGYSRKAQGMKAGRSWLSWGVGCAATFIIFLVLNKQ